MSNGAPLLDLIIDISDSLSDRILVYHSSSPHQLALAFQQKHRLPHAVIPHLIAKIHQSVQQVTHGKENLHQAQPPPPKPSKEHRPWAPCKQDTQLTYDDSTFESSFIASKQPSKKELSVFERLSHIPPKDGQQISRVSFQPRPTIKHCHSQKVVNRLYTQSLSRRQQKQKQAERERNRKMAESLQQCTHRPRIGQVTEALCSSRSKQRISERLTINEHSKKQVLQKIRKDLILAQLKQCSFRPTISNISRQIVAFKQAKHMPLYNQKKHEQQQRFIGPVIGSKSRMLASRVGLNFNQRVEYYQKKHDQDLERLREIEEQKQLSDRVTVMPAAKSSDPSRRGGLSISQYLYSLTKKPMQQPKPLPIKANLISTLIVDNLRRTKLEQIFQLLDSDADGRISAESVEIEHLPIAKLQVIAPLLVGMQQEGVVLEREQFVQAAAKLVRTLSPLEKRVLFMSE